MVKILSNIYRHFLSQRMDNLQAKNSFLKDLLMISKLNFQKQGSDNFQEETSIQNNKLTALAKQLSVETKALSDLKQAELSKIDEHYYWKKRALEQSKQRKAKRQLPNKVETWYVAKLAKLNLEEQQTKAYLDDKYHFTDKLEALMEYQKASDEVKNYLVAYEQVAKEWVNKKTATFTTKIQAKMAHIEQKYHHVKTKYAHLLDDKTLKNDVLKETSVLRLEHLSMHFGGLKAVDNLSFEVQKGEIFGLIGPNGAGKTTVFNCITQFYKPTSGNIYYSNNKEEIINLNNFKTHEIIKEGIVRTFQNVELIWEISVLDNLLVSGHTLYKTGFFAHVFGTKHLHQEESVLRQKALNILAKLNLLAYQSMIPYGLPYGILKKVELARTLMVNPRLIILDEPAAGLNEEETNDLSKLIKQIRDEYQVTIFLVEHDMGLVMNLCDTICAISFGKLLAIGKPAEIQKNKLVIEAYLGGE